MGYSATQKGYLLFDIHDKKKFVSRNVEFKEDVFPFDQNTQQKEVIFLEVSQETYLYSIPTEGKINIQSQPVVVENHSIGQQST